MKEEIKPVIIDGEVIPGYYVSNLGKAYCAKYKLPQGRYGFKTVIDESRMFEMSLKDVKGGNKPPQIGMNIPDDILTEYDYARRRKHNQRQLKKYIHQLVMAAFRPLDEYPPVPKEDWDVCPESVKKWIRETVVINHIDHNPLNNNVNNLEYVTPRENTRKAVEHYGGHTSYKNKVIPKKQPKQKVITLMDFV